MTDLNDLFDVSAISAQTAAFNTRIEALLAETPSVHTLPPALVRTARAEGRGALPVGGPLEGSEWVDIPGAPGGPARVRVTEPAGPPTGVYLHIHGGGWAIGAPDQNDRSCQQMAAETGMRVVSVAYRLAPEHPWPAQKLDCMAAAHWVLEQSDLPMVIGGESAGAHLAVVTALGLRDAGLADRLRGLVLFYGCYDLRCTPSVRNWGDRYLVLSTPVINWFTDMLDPDGTARGGADLSPLLADLSGMPPAVFLVGTADPLLDDTLFMAQRWRAAGHDAALHVYPGGIHAFDAFPEELEIARASRQVACDFARDCLAGHATPAG